METVFDRLAFYGIKKEDEVRIIFNNEIIVCLCKEFSENDLKKHVLNDTLINGELTMEVY